MNVRRSLVVVLVVRVVLHSVARCNGFHVSSRSAFSHQPPPSSSAKRRSWHHSSPGRSSRAWKTYLWSQEPSSSDDAQEDNSNTFRTKLQRTWNDFSFGASYVNNNYLNLFWLVQSRALLGVAVTWLIVGVGLGVSQSAGSVVVRWILQILTALSYVGETLSFVLVLIFLTPFMLPTLFGLALRKNTTLTGIVKRWNSTVVTPMLAFMEQLVGNSVTSIREMPIATNVLTIAVLAPILEEFEYRYVFDRMRRRMVGRQKRNGVETNQRRQLNNTSRFVGSFIFACAHIRNWLAPELFPAKLLATKAAVMVISLTVMQFGATFQLSQRVLFPLYEKHGVWTSIGAHASWNALTMANFLNVPIRLVCRAWRRIKGEKQAEPSDE